MQLAKVIGDVVATRKDDTLHGLKLLVLQPIAADGSAAGRTLVAADAIGAGVGETVFFVRGKEASFPFHPVETAVFAMNKGDVSKEPVKTQFGFHVIKVEDKRNAPPPEFDQVKDQVKQIVLRDKYMEVLKTTKAAAKIEIEDPALKKAYDESAKPVDQQ